MTTAAHANLPSEGGDTLALYCWPASDRAEPARATVLIAHGLGEHAGRYAEVAALLNGIGCDVWALDHFGHGHSTGARGGLPTSDRFIHDLARAVDHVNAQRPATQPLVLLGHSMGGLIAASFVARKLRPVDALVLSSPALGVTMTGVQRWLVGTLSKYLPNLRVGNGLKVEKISHDPAVVAAYQADPLVHDRISTLLGAWFASEGPAVVAKAPRWTVPTLLLYAGADQLVDPAAADAFAAAAPKAVVQAQRLDGLYHEIFNERQPDRARVYALLTDWLQPRITR